MTSIGHWTLAFRYATLTERCIKGPERPTSSTGYMKLFDHGYIVPFVYIYIYIYICRGYVGIQVSRYEQTYIHIYRAVDR